MTQNSFHKHLSMPGMLSEVRECFDSIPDPVVSRGITLSGCLITALGVFSLKMTSLLSFEEKIRSDESPEPAENFKSLFGVDQIPSDTRLRERLDDVDPRRLRPTFKNIFTGLQRRQRLPLTFELASLATTLGVRHGLVILDAQQYHSGGCLVGGTSVKGEKCCVSWNTVMDWGHTSARCSERR